MPMFSVSDRYRIFCDGMSAGIVKVKLTEEGIVWGVIEFDEEIKSQWGWKAKRIATALDAFSEFVRVRDEEGEDSQSNRMQLAIERVEDGEIGHYLFVVPWHVCDETRELRLVDLVAYLDDGRIGWSWCDEGEAVESTNAAMPLFGADRDILNYRLVMQSAGRHVFGGPPRHKVTPPVGSDVSLHHFLSIDLADLKSPFHYRHGGIRYLPLYYPLAYGNGGAELQYEVVSDDEIRIIELDGAPSGGVDIVPILPRSNADIVALTYEEVRLRLFAQHPTRPEFDSADLRLWERMGGVHAVLFGGRSWSHNGGGFCKNPACSATDGNLEMITVIPPIPIDGKTDFWGDYDNVGVDFCFGLCPSCRTIIAYNTCD